jgi:UDP-N-acetyl-2-amino-2-deoxyglucuronate dehydrogenase
MDPMTRTIALIGLGNVAEAHLAAYAALRCVKVVAVVDPRPERRREIADRYQVRPFATCEEMLGEVRPDIACVLTPASTHRILTEQCASAGIHILCEKPIAVTMEDAYAMRLACEAAKVELFYGSSYRYLPAVYEAKRLVEQGVVGTVRLIIEQTIGGRGPAAHSPLSEVHYPHGGPGGGGYGLVDHGIHMLDIFPWLCRSRIQSVIGRGDRSGATARPEFALLSMENGALGVLLYDGSTWSSETPWEGMFSQSRQWLDGRGWAGVSGEWDPTAGSIRVYGTEGALRIFHYANKMFVNESGRVREHTLPAETAPWHFGRQLLDFCASLDRHETPESSIDDGIRALEALLAIYDSDSLGRWQCAPYPRIPGRSSLPL